MAVFRAPAPNISSLLSLDGEAFARQAYKRLLNREADASGLKSVLEKLRTGVPKEQILTALESTPEGRLVIRQRGGVSLTAQIAAPSPAKPPSPRPTTVQELLAQEAGEFLQHAYPLVVGRAPDPQGLESLSMRMAGGLAATQV